MAERAATEAFARDSFENLLFGLCRFKECVGRYPDTVTIVSWGFKATRFGLHREAIRWPASRFTFVGISEPADLEGARGGGVDDRSRRSGATLMAPAPISAAKRAEREPLRRPCRV